MNKRFSLSNAAMRIRAALGQAAGRNAEESENLEPFCDVRPHIPRHKTPAGLPKTVRSICPECGALLDASEFAEDGKVYMRKRCSKHGEFLDLISSDERFYLKMEKWTFEDEGGILNPTRSERTSCPEACGLCEMHLATACQLNIDLTNRCNLHCPFCFANANASGWLYEVTREQVETMLRAGRSVEPRRNSVVQFAGGEPTLHSDFLWACSKAKQEGFTYVMVATNGITLARSLEFAERCREAGLDAIYLQFDGMSDEVYVKTRGKPLLELKLKAVENARRAGIRVVLVPTIIRGVNDHEIGAIIKFGLENLDIMNGISFQPVSFTGRISLEERLEQRFTLADLAHEVQKQTGYLDPYKDWYPLSFTSPLSRFMEKMNNRPTMTITCHSDCGVGAYILSDGEGHAVPVTRFVDMESAMIEINELGKTIVPFLRKPLAFAQFHHVLHKHCHIDSNLGFTFSDFIGALSPTLTRGASAIGKSRKWRFLIILAMHFQDAYNFNLDRVRRCNIHYAAPDGRIYPFCTYNGGPTHRERLEKSFGRPISSKP